MPGTEVCGCWVGFDGSSALTCAAMSTSTSNSKLSLGLTILAFMRKACARIHP